MTFISFIAAPPVIEDAGEGYDTAYALQDLISLPALYSVELLAPDPTVARTIGVTFIASDAVNELRGTEFADSLNGMGGADLMIGYGGNDSYWMDEVGDAVVEEVGGGTDTIRTSINFTLSENGNVENLTARNSNGTTPTTPLSLGGNSFANVITGGNGGDIIVAGGGDDTLFGLDGNDSLYGDAGNDIIDGGNGSDLMFGGEGNDTLLGQAGNDVLDGEGGTNMLDGGQGNDTYYVNSASDIVTGETSSNGNDVVYARVSYALGSGSSVRIEVLSTDSLAGTAAINLTGNEFAQEIDGNAGDNFLNGGGGADVLVGFGGDDQYYITTGNETIVEAAGQGRDVAYTVASHVLAEGIHLEVLSTTSIVGTAAINLTGNAFVQEIDGNNGANILNGGGGADTLVGFGGDDTYYVINGGEFVVEAAGGGRDVVYATTSFALTAGTQVEILSTASFGSTTAINLTGNELGQELYGNAGANVLNGGAGADYLAGLGGADFFDFTTALGGGNVDTVGDLVSGTDKIRLDNAVFAGLSDGALPASAFVIGSAAGDADDRIVYNQTTGQLFYDADGNGGAAAVLFATLNPGQALSASDFQVI